MNNWTEIRFVNDAVTAEEIGARERLHAAIEAAADNYMRESKRQDIIGIEVFPCDCADCVEAA